MSATYRAAFTAKAIHPVGVLLFAPELADGSPHFWRQPTARYEKSPLDLLLAGDGPGFAGVWFRDPNGMVCCVRPLHPDRVWRDHDPAAGRGMPAELRAGGLHRVEVRSRTLKTTNTDFAAHLTWNDRGTPWPIHQWRFAK